LRALGIDVIQRTLLPDDDAAIAGALREWDGRVGLVIATGGLGPTSDDLSREGICRAFGLELHEDPAVLAAIRTRYRARGVEVSAWSARQAQVPAGAEVLANEAGTAPGLMLARPSGTRFILLPGVPHEMEHLMVRAVLPRLEAEARAAGWMPRQRRGFKVSGMVEVQVQEALDGLEGTGAGEGVGLTLLASPGEISVILRAHDTPLLDRAAAEARARLGSRIFTENLDDGLEHAVGRLLHQRGFTLATAESCTGGLLGQLVTRVPGASGWYVQGWITYANEAKSTLLGVDPAVIQAHGAVSEEVARAMAEGACARARTDRALAITGIAGPDGGTPDKPVGLTFVALASGASCVARRYQLGGDRDVNRLYAARLALNLLRRDLMESV
jgi:nicotinamide-nucleotide amidase